MWMPCRWRHMMGCHVGGGTWTWGDPDVRDRWPLVTEPWGQGGQIARPRSRKHLNITGSSKRKASIGNQEKVLIWKHESSVVDNISYTSMNFEIRSFISCLGNQCGGELSHFHRVLFVCGMTKVNLRCNIPIQKWMLHWGQKVSQNCQDSRERPSCALLSSREYLKQK